MLTTVIGIIIGFLPSGLPFCLILALTLIAKQMAANNVVVKSLPTVETLGNVDVLASDKTGTLTQNKMTVVRAFILPGTTFKCLKKTLDADVKKESNSVRKLIQLAYEKPTQFSRRIV